MTKTLISFLTAACLLLAALVFTTRPAEATFSPGMLQGTGWLENLSHSIDSVVFEDDTGQPVDVLTVPPGRSFVLVRAYAKSSDSVLQVVSAGGLNMRLNLPGKEGGSSIQYSSPELIRLNEGDRITFQSQASGARKTGYITGFWLP